jgi:AbrB family looped-hinge helix DNA binding protein
MKSVEIVRKVDELGRVVIPMQLRKKLEITEKDPLEIFVEGDHVILKKYEPKKKIFKYFDTCDDMQPKQAIKKASVKFDISKDVVENYYWKWRKQYVHLLKVEV